MHRCASLLAAFDADVGGGTVSQCPCVCAADVCAQMYLYNCVSATHRNTLRTS